MTPLDNKNPAVCGHETSPVGGENGALHVRPPVKRRRALEKRQW
jgi:hypothetical protein